MHIQDCLDPKRIINPYSHEVMYVPCGKCSACLNARASRWVQRLDQERYCWQYALFFTLTYSPEYVPTLCKDKNGFYIDTSSEHFNISARKCFPCIDSNEELSKITGITAKSQFSKEFILSNQTIHYLSSYDVQKFMKRIRIHLQRKTKDKNEKIRFFIAGEYGPEHYRPHYHGIFFFNSEKAAALLPELIREDWQFGFTDSSFVSGTNSKYVASYLNCTSHLPQIYRNKFLRPFILCSKCPPIGTLVHSTEEVQKIFYEASPEFVIQNNNKSTAENVRLWSYYQNKLFPRLSFYNKFTDFDRITLYRSYERVPHSVGEEITFSDFIKYVTSDRALPVEKSYVAHAKSFKDDINNSLLRWYSISSRVFWQSLSFGISSRNYVKQIFKFYDNVEKLRLNKQFEFEEEYSENYGSDSLIGLDIEFLQTIFDNDLENLSAEEIETLRGFGVDLDKLYSDDLTIRIEYQKTLVPFNTWDYLTFKIDSEIIRNKNTKTKRKNEFIEFSKERSFVDMYVHRQFGDF